MTRPICSVCDARSRSIGCKVASTEAITRSAAGVSRKRSRDDGAEPAHSPRGAGPQDRDREDDLARDEGRSRGRGDDDTRSLGRGGGGGSDRQSTDEPSRDARDDARWPERDRQAQERPRNPHDVFTRHLDMPRGPERERVRDRDRVYTLRGSESRTLATVGAFRVVSSGDLRDHDGSRANLRSGDLRHLREQGLIETARQPGYRDHAVGLTKAGHSLLERHRDSHPERHRPSTPASSARANASTTCRSTAPTRRPRSVSASAAPTSSASCSTTN